MTCKALALAFGAVCIMQAAPIAAQDRLSFSLGQPAGQAATAGFALRTIDDERLFRESAFGLRVTAEISAASEQLEAENIALLEQLTARETELTELRSVLTVEEFRAAAAEFDFQAETIRRDQAEKRQRLSQFEESERRRFFSQLSPILQEVLEREGGQILIDARAVIIGLPEMDLTGPAVSAVDAALGDGAPAPFPLRLP